MPVNILVEVFHPNPIQTEFLLRLEMIQGRIEKGTDRLKMPRDLEQGFK